MPYKETFGRDEEFDKQFLKVAQVPCPFCGDEADSSYYVVEVTESHKYRPVLTCSDGKDWDGMDWGDSECTAERVEEVRCEACQEILYSWDYEGWCPELKELVGE